MSPQMNISLFKPLLRSTARLFPSSEFPRASHLTKHCQMVPPPPSTGTTVRKAHVDHGETISWWAWEAAGIKGEGCEGPNAAASFAPFPSARIRACPIRPSTAKWFSLSPQWGPRCAKRTLTMGKPFRGGLGKPLGLRVRGVKVRMWLRLSRLFPPREFARATDSTKRCQMVLPLPKGEGRGEGGCFTEFSPFGSWRGGA
jgi:hypothetical protein